MSRQQRYRFVLVEEPTATLPVRYVRRPRPRPRWSLPPNPFDALWEAFATLERRGVGREGWAPALADNPLTFLLDALDEAVRLREADGRLIYRNPAARRLGLDHLEDASTGVDEIELDQGRFRRRCMVFHRAGRRFVLEVIRRL